MAKDRSFQYQPRGKEKIKERANARGGNFDSFIKPQYKRYKIKDGKNRIRIMPPTWEKPDHYGYDVWVNYDIGVDNQSYLSLSKMKKERDPLDEARRSAQHEGDDELAKKLSPRQRIVMWIIDRAAEDEGPQIFDAPFTLDKSFANLSIDPDTSEVVYIDDPKDGCDITFYKEGTGMLTKYDASKMRLGKTSFLNEDEDKENEWLAFIQENPVPECLQFYDYEHIAGAFQGIAGSRDDGDEKPRARRERAAPEPTETRRRAAPEPEVTTRARAEEPKPVRTRVAVTDHEDDEPVQVTKPAGESIKERLARRRSAPVAKEPEEEPPFDEDE